MKDKNELAILEDVTIEVVDNVLDEICKNELLNLFPGVKIGVALCKVGKGYAENRLKKRLINFLNECKELDKKEVEKFLKKNVKNEEKTGRIFLDALFNLDMDEKARLAGRVYCYCVKNSLDLDTYNRILKTITECYFADLLFLCDIGNKNYINDGIKIPTEIVEGLYTHGLLNNIGIDGGGFSDNEPGGAVYVLNKYGKIIEKLLY